MEIINGWKQYSDEEIGQAEKILKTDFDNPICKYYLTLGQSDSSKGVRFVLYKHLLECKSPHVNPFQFQAILADDLIEAAKKARTYTGKTEVVIDFDSNKLISEYRKPNIIPFGKYKGQHIEDVLQSDPSYVLWLANSMRRNSDNSKKYIALSNRLEEVREQAKEKITENNLEKYKGGWVGNEGEEITVTGVVHKIQEDFGACKVKIIDANENRFQKYISGKILENLNVGDVISFTANVSKHGEYLGVKTTYMNGIIKYFKKIVL